jgi:hypothetical protein
VTRRKKVQLAAQPAGTNPLPPITGVMAVVEPPDKCGDGLEPFPPGTIVGCFGGPVRWDLVQLTPQAGLFAAIEWILRTQPWLQEAKGSPRDDRVRRRLEEISVEFFGSRNAIKAASEAALRRDIQIVIQSIIPERPPRKRGKQDKKQTRK